MRSYKGSNFAVAQSIACMRALPFRDYVKTTTPGDSLGYPIDVALADRMSATPFPADDFEEDGMLVSLAWIYASRNPESLEMLRKVAAAAGRQDSQSGARIRRQARDTAGTTEAAAK
jgi:hypothetical protein